MMISAVVLILALAAPALSLPLTPPEAGNEKVTQILTEVPFAQFVEKTGVQGSPEIYSPVGQTLQANTPVPRVENVPVNVEQVQGSYSENPVLLPIQPLSVLPSGQAGQVSRPVIVPAEAIASGKVIIASAEPIQQRNFDQNQFVESQVPYQQVAHPVTYTPVLASGVEPNQQPYYVQANEKHTPLQQGVTPTGQGYPSVQPQSNQETFVREQSVPVINPLQQNAESIQNYNPVPVESNPQLYSATQNVQQAVPESPEKNVPYQVASGYPVQTVQQQFQQVEEKHGVSLTQIQGLEHVPQYQTYSGKPTVSENAEKQTPYQQSSQYQYQQSAEKHGEYQQFSSHAPVQNQPVDQQIYNVQSVDEKQGHYQPGYAPVETQSVEPQQQQTVQQGVQSQIPYQEPVQRLEPIQPVFQQEIHNVQPVAAEQVHKVQAQPVESVSQQQVYSTQPLAADQVESQVPQQQLYNQQSVGYVPVQTSKASEVEHQQPYNANVPQGINYTGETTYNFGDIIPQPNPVNTLSGVPQTQKTVVQPSVAITQE